jgi:hypothetical protein
MKKITILLIMLALTASVFASGSRENAQGTNDPGFGRINGETVTLSGTMNVTDAEVFLLTDEGSFTLSAPRARMLDLESFNALYATVSGQLTDCDDCADGYDGHIFIEKAVADGEEYDFAVTGPQNNSNNMKDNGKGNADQNQRFGGMQDTRNNMAEDYGKRNADQSQRFGGMQDTRNNVEESRGRGNVRNVQDSNFGGRGSI